MSVNLSAKQVRQADFIQVVEKILNETKLDPHHLKLEITETAIMEQYKSIEGLFTKFKERAIQISLDDFGTGFSSLSHLYRFPVDVVKIDISFINEMMTDERKAKIVVAITTLAHSLGMKVVAEGIETKAQLGKLKSIRCDYGQGFLLSKPLDKAGAAALIANAYCPFMPKTPPALP